MRYGYTTGSCAAAAAKAATQMLLSDAPISKIVISTPKGVDLMLDILETRKASGTVECAIRKDSGDDPDVTDGMLVFASVKRIEQGIEIEGGEGVGRVTKPGLDQPVGAAAINSVPRQMIKNEVEIICKEWGYKGGIAVTISIPKGVELAKRTFNPRLGIEGGISIIGTSGIVEPMSNQALVDTIKIEIRQLAASGAKDILLTPGNYGEKFAKESLKMSLRGRVICSNFIGDAIDAAVEEGFLRILLVGHIGKLVKLGIGMTNTHSSYGDGRIEALIVCALQAGADLPLLHKLTTCVTTDATLQDLHKAGLMKETLSILGKRIEDCLQRRVPENIEIGFICFSNASPIDSILAQSKNADTLTDIWRIEP